MFPSAQVSVSIWDIGIGILPGAEGSLGQLVPGSLVICDTAASDKW